MNKLKIFTLSLLFGLSISSCVEDENYIDPGNNNFNDSIYDAKQMMPILIYNASQSVYDHAEYNIYLSQCLTTTGKSQTGSYPYKQGWEFLNVNRHPQWRRHFYDLGRNAQQVCDLNGTSNDDLIARTIMLMSTQLTTDAFSEMPMLHNCQIASTGEYGDAFISINPHYESQTDIYNWMFSEADALIAAFENQSRDTSGDVKIDAQMDRVYQGDLNKWKGLVYAMKARLLLRNIPNVDMSKCQQIIDVSQKAIDIWRSSDLLYGSWFGNEPRYNYESEGGTESYSPWSSAQPKINSLESRANRLAEDAVPSRFFMETCLGINFPGVEGDQGTFNIRKCNGYGNDPRIMLLMKPAEGPKSPLDVYTKQTAYRYLENNIGTSATYKRKDYPDLYYGAYAGALDAYNVIFTMEELYFIQAEAYYWLGNKAKACELAKEATEWNIQRHLDSYLKNSGGIYPDQAFEPGKIDNEYTANMWKARFEAWKGAFLNNEKTSVKYSGKDANGKEKSGTATGFACSTVGNKRWFFDAANYTLSDLMMQKYIAMYMQPEQWTDLRRYHYSNNRNGVIPTGETKTVYQTLRRPYNLYKAYWVNGLTDTQKENTWIQRLNYDPQTEDIYNKDEVVRLGAYKDYKWLQKPMIWAEAAGARSSLTN